MADINELEKRLAKLEEGFNKLASIIIQASEEKKASSDVIPPHVALAGEGASAGYLASNYNGDDDAMELGMLMAGADAEHAAKIERQASLFKNSVKEQE